MSLSVSYHWRQFLPKNGNGKPNKMTNIGRIGLFWKGTGTKTNICHKGLNFQHFSGWMNHSISKLIFYMENNHRWLKNVTFLFVAHFKKLITCDRNKCIETFTNWIVEMRPKVLHFRVIVENLMASIFEIRNTSS